MTSPDDPKVIKIAPSTLRAEGFLEGDDNAGDTVTVPDWTEDSVPKPEGDAMGREEQAEIRINENIIKDKKISIK